MHNLAVLAGHAETNPDGSLILGLCVVIAIAAAAVWVYRRLRGK